MESPSAPPPVPVIRPALPGDADSVAACVTAAFSPYIERMGKPPGPMLTDFLASILLARVWVAEMDSRVVGVLVQYETEQGFYIDTLAVHPAHQGTGLGRLLLGFAENEARRRGFQSIYLCTNIKMTENQVFYPRLGYIAYDRKLDHGYERIFYRKRLQ